MAELKCSNGTVIEYRLPNVIELLELKHEAKWGQESESGHSMLANVLKNSEKFIVSIKGKKDFDECLNTRSMSEDLSTFALSLVKDDLEENEKKS